ncbi:hypothetical protein MUGA111182_12205 [Mucilaginibacter galii]|uniref:DUF4369 domain-containing protein n=1 Tax=Mucilaginibacter galii TaxID=2005073 RepID=A0A917N2L2_9SPHI|nr:hypothetical protein [Mucilaginibacter galii]GGI52023.1 hypothetical protein GCM10011425_32350 [Mucilaginibacter galii]
MRTILLLVCILSVTFSAKAQMFGRDWVEGRVYDLNNKKFNGFIAWTPPEPTWASKLDDHLYFKDDKKKKNEIEVRSSKIKGFVMGADSFVVSHDIQVATAPFIAVILNNPIKLFASYATRSAPAGGIGPLPIGFSFRRSKKVFYYGVDHDLLTKLEKSNFIEIMSAIMSNKPDVVAKIKDKTYKYGDIQDLLDYYWLNQPPTQTSN